MDFLIFAIIWYVVGFIGINYVSYLPNKQLLLGDFLFSFFSAIGGPLCVAVLASFKFSDKVLYKKKR